MSMRLNECFSKVPTLPLVNAVDVPAPYVPVPLIIAAIWYIKGEPSCTPCSSYDSIKEPAYVERLTAEPSQDSKRTSTTMWYYSTY